MMKFNTKLTINTKFCKWWNLWSQKIQLEANPANIWRGLISFLFFFLTPSFFLPKNGGELRVESIDLGGGRRALAPLENWVCTIGFVRHPVIGNISLNGCYQLIWGHHFTVEDSTTALLPQIPCCVSPPGDVLYALVVKNCHHVVKVVSYHGLLYHLEVVLLCIQQLSLRRNTADK